MHLKTVLLSTALAFGAIISPALAGEKTEMSALHADTIQITIIDNTTGETRTLSGDDARADSVMGTFFDAEGDIDMAAVKAYKADHPDHSINIHKTVTRSSSDVKVHKGCAEDMAMMFISGGDVDFDMAELDRELAELDIEMAELDRELADIEIELEGMDLDMAEAMAAGDLHRKIIIKKMGDGEEVHEFKFGGDGAHSWTDENGNTTVVLSESMVVDIAKDGEVHVIRDGQTVEDYQLEGGASDVTVDKDVKIENGKKKTRIVIEMETDADE